MGIERLSKQGQHEIGVYVLEQDVDNPQADQRHKYDWTKVKKFKAGNRFVVGFDQFDPDLVQDIPQLQGRGRNTINPMGGGSQVMEGDSTGIFEAIMPHLRKLDSNKRTLGVVLKVEGSDICARGDEVLAFLIDHGIIDIKHVSYAVGTMREWKDEEWEAHRQKHDL